MFHRISRLELEMVRLLDHRALQEFAYAGVTTIGLRGRALVDLAVLTSLFESILWVWHPAKFQAAVVIGSIVIALVSVGVVVRQFPKGMPSVNGSSARVAWKLSTIYTVGAMLISVGIAWPFGFLEQEWGWQAFERPKPLLPVWFLKEVGIVLFQQVLLQYVIFPLATQIVGFQWAALVLTGAIFSFFHMPNPLAMALTFIIAPLWCLIFLAGGKRLLPVMFSHTVLFVVIIYALPWHITLGLAVGPKAIPRLQMLRWVYNQGQFSQLLRYGSQAFYEEAGGKDGEFVEALFQQIRGRKPNRNEATYLRNELKHHTRQFIAFWLMADHVAHGP